MLRNSLDLWNTHFVSHLGSNIFFRSFSRWFFCFPLRTYLRVQFSFSAFHVFFSASMRFLCGTFRPKPILFKYFVRVVSIHCNSNHSKFDVRLSALINGIANGKFSIRPKWLSYSIAMNEDFSENFSVWDKWFMIKVKNGRKHWAHALWLFDLDLIQSKLAPFIQ